MGGLTVVHPMLGVAALKAYSAYSHAGIGLALLGTYRKWKSGEESPSGVGRDVVKLGGKVVAGRMADTMSATMVGELRRSGVIDSVAKKTGINSNIYSQMLEGSISEAESQGLDNFAGYEVRRAE
jgi:hypothetical protein